MRCFAALVLAAVVCLGQGANRSQRRVYIAPDDHTDYMWTADEETYRRTFVETIDYYLAQADRTAGHDADHRSRWNCDGSLWMWAYEKSKPQSEFNRFIGRVRDGHISVPLNTVASCFGATPAEAVLRGMYYAGRIERKYGLRFPLAVAMENQTLPYGLGALWAGSGAQYSWRGICGCASLLMPVRHTLRPHEIYWWAGPDDSRILMKWNSLLRENSGKGLSANECIGGYAEAFQPAASLDFVETDKRFREAWPWSVVGVFGKGWDHLKTLDQQVVELAKDRSTPERRIIVSNEEDFFRDFEKTHGKDLPVFSAAFGNEWDLYIASVPELSARAKRAVERLRTAEAMATMVALKQPDLLRGREHARDLAFLNLGLFWEHNWTADGPILRSARADWGRRIVGEIESYVSRLENDAAMALGSLIPKRGTHPRFYVFNALSWERTDYADLAWDGAADVHVVDASTGREVPWQMVQQNSRTYGKGRRALRVLAERIPSVGYRVFEVRPGKGAAALPPVATWRDGVFESELYRISVAPNGSMTSLVDKTRGARELARTRNGQALNDLGPGEGQVTLENAGPVSATLRIDVKGTPARTTRITLSRRGGRVEVQNEITENFADVRSWKFHFNVDAPDIWHEEVGAVIRARLTSDGGHYSPVHSRLDWLSLNHFAAISGRDGVGVTLSSPDLSFMRLGDSEVVKGVSKLDTSTPGISVLAGGQVDGPKLGVPRQGGDSYFLQRFALIPHTRYSAPESMRVALEHQNPLLAAPVTGGANDYPADSYSLVTLNDPDTLLWALKPSEEGIRAGVIARVWNLSEAAKTLTLSLAGSARSTEAVTHIETPTGSAPKLSQPVKPRQMITLRVR